METQPGTIPKQMLNDNSEGIDKSFQKAFNSQKESWMVADNVRLAVRKQEEAIEYIQNKKC